MHSSTSVLLAIAATAASKTIVINSGQGGLTFSPDSTTAAVGDVLEFHFFNAFHTAVQGDYATPCMMGSLMNSGFDSGPFSNKADGSPNVFQVTVKDTDPMWFYCSTPSHCQSGMAGVINPPASGDSLATYKSNAAGTSSSNSAGKVQGGVVVPVGGSSSSSGSSSKAGTTASTPPTSSAPAPPVSSGTTSAATTSASSAASSSGEASESYPESASSTGSSVSAATTGAAVATGNSTAPITSPSLLAASGGWSLMDNKAGIISATIGMGIFVLLAV